MTKVEEARHALPGQTVRYVYLTADPGTVLRELCSFLNVEFEPARLASGQFAHGRFGFGLGDSSENIRSGRIQPATPAPERIEISPALAEMCATWDYLLPGEARLTTLSWRVPVICGRESSVIMSAGTRPGSVVSRLPTAPGSAGDPSRPGRGP